MNTLKKLTQLNATLDEAIKFARGDILLKGAEYLGHDSRKFYLPSVGGNIDWGDVKAIAGRKAGAKARSATAKKIRSMRATRG